MRQPNDHQNFLLLILLTHSLCRTHAFSPVKLSFLVRRAFLLEPCLKNFFLALVSRASCSSRAMYIFVLSIVTERGFPIVSVKQGVCFQVILLMKYFSTKFKQASKCLCWSQYRTTIPERFYVLTSHRSLFHMPKIK